jgi:hypothetical protein
MPMKQLVAAAVLVLFAAACGAPGTGSGANPSPTPSPGGVGFDVVATNSDHAVTMHVGQKLEVVLRAGQGMNDWTHPQSSDQSVLQPIVDPAATAAIGVTLAAFQALAPGEVDVTSNGSPKCSPGQACPMYLAVYSLRVSVTK